MKRVVILGGGFGGVYAARRLLKSPIVKVVMISKTNYFLFTPLLHEAAVGSLNRHNIVEPIRDLFKSENFSFIRAEAKAIDTIKKIVIAGKSPDEIKIHYDYLIAAIGSRPNFYNIKGAEKYAMPLKTIKDSIKIRNSIIDSLERKKADFAIIGGGATGVEVSGDIADFVKENAKKYNIKKSKIYLIQAAKDILPGSAIKDQAMAYLKKKGITVLTNSPATEIGRDYIIIGNKKKIRASVIIWCGGIKPNEIKTIPRLQDKKGYFAVDEFLRAEKSVFAIGDCSYNKSNPAPFLAQAAVQQAETASQNILNIIQNKKLKKFKFINKGFIVSVGKRNAVGEINYPFKLKIKGLAAWVLKRHIYLINIIGLKNKIKVGIEWLLNLIFERDTSEI